MDYKGRPFGPMPNLMAIAEYVTKLHAICTKTGKMANYTSRKVDNKNLIMVGDKNKYEALCREAFYNKKLINNEKDKILCCIIIRFIIKTI